MKRSRKTILSLLLTIICAACLVSTALLSYGCKDGEDSSINQPYDDDGWTLDY
jgi:hypothetical protein